MLSEMHGTTIKKITVLFIIVYNIMSKNSVYVPCGAQMESCS